MKDLFLVKLVTPFPLKCGGCGRVYEEEYPVCGECRAKLEEEAPVLYFADKERFAFSAAAHAYYDQSAFMIRYLKYAHVSSIADIMAGDMIAAYLAFGSPEVDIVTCVPMPSLRRKFRGFNQAQLLAKHFSRSTGLTFEELLKRTGETKQQARLRGRERLMNEIGAFAPRRALNGERILLIDDVHTTGATSNECAEVLLKAGAGSVGLITYAKSLYGGIRYEGFDSGSGAGDASGADHRQGTEMSGPGQWEADHL